MERGYGNVADAQALHGIEGRLNELHDAIGALRPAESLAGFDERIFELSRKIDSFGDTSPDPETLRYLEAAINELRELSAGVASAEGVAALAGDVQSLGARIDHIAAATGATGLDSLAIGRELFGARAPARADRPAAENIEVLVQTLATSSTGRNLCTIRPPLSSARAAHRGIAEKIEAADRNSISGIERGIQQLTLQVREAREEAITTAERVARAVAADIPRGNDESVRHNLEALHAYQAESDQRTQDTLEAVHDTLERLVERLAKVETGLHAPAHAPEPVRAADMMRAPEPMRAMPAHEGAPEARIPEPPVAMPAQIFPAPLGGPPGTPFVLGAARTAADRPDLPADTRSNPAPRAALASRADRRLQAALGPALGALKREGRSPEGELHRGRRPPRRPPRMKAARSRSARRRAQTRRNADQPDWPVPRQPPPRLMVGVARCWCCTEQCSSSGCSAAPTVHKNRRARHRDRRRRRKRARLQLPRRRWRRQRATGRDEPGPAPPDRQSSVPAAGRAGPDGEPDCADTDRAASERPQFRPRTSPPRSSRHSISRHLRRRCRRRARNCRRGAAGRQAAGGRRGACAARSGRGRQSGRRVRDRRALCGRPRRAGRPGTCRPMVQRRHPQACAAQYRLGSLFEKGQGVKKDLNKARTLYLQAADQGNAKAIHNLAVLYAEGIDGKPDYQNAGQWFRKAATRGVATANITSGSSMRAESASIRTLPNPTNGSRSRRRRATRTRPRSGTMWPDGSTSSRSSRRGLRCRPLRRTCRPTRP